MSLHWVLVLPMSSPALTRTGGDARGNERGINGWEVGIEVDGGMTAKYRMRKGSERHFYRLLAILTRKKGAVGAGDRA